MVSTAISGDRWHHVAGTYDPQPRPPLCRRAADRLGDGVRRQDRLRPPSLGGLLGAFRGACNLTFRGDVDELRLWSAALSIDAIWGRISAFLDLEPAAPGLPEDASEWYSGG